MMLRSTLRLLALAAALALVSCGGGRGEDTAKIVPRMESSDAPKGSPDDSETQRPRIGIPSGEKVLALIEARLDSDPAPEQIIAVKRPDEVESPVRLLVADASANTRYSLSGEAETAATSTRVFELSTSDMVGDHGVAILASGIDGDGRRTLDVYRAAARVKGQGLGLSSICRVIADDIRIDRPDRPEAYTSGQKNGDCYPIAAYSRDPDSQNPMDLVKVTYLWQASQGRFVPGAPEKIPGEKVEQKQLEKLYTSADTDGFEKFLSGAWVEVRGADRPSQARAGAIVYFQPGTRSITLSTGDTQEVYVWRESLRTLYDRLLVIAENEEKNKISRTFSIRASSLGTLEITNQGSDSGDTATTTYTRVTDEIRRKYLDPQSPAVTLMPPVLQGAYLDNKGRRLAFEGDRVSWSEGRRIRAGSCVYFSLDDHQIVGIRFFDESGAPAETLHFTVDVHEKRDMGRIMRTLILTPVQLRVSGFEEAVGERITLEQTAEIPKK